MFITELKINGFRCFQTVDLKFKKQVNILYGKNGTGKTSILESIFWLSTGKSFRSKNNKSLINHESSEFTLFSRFFGQNKDSTQKLGISYNGTNKKKSIKLNQSTITNQSEIAHMLPVISIDPDSYLFIDKGPQFRRSFLDWLVFHVKPSYLKIWTQAMKCHKQVNALLKTKQTNQLEEWENQYLHYAVMVNEQRKEIFDLLKQKVVNKVSSFIPELSDFNILYFQGWHSEMTLNEVLNKDRSKNLNYGSLNSGVHKMDIKCKIKNTNANELLSRGQKKIISIIFYLSYIEILTEVTGLDPIICLDDLDAELDSSKTHILCDFIRNANNQVFISTVDKSKLHSLFKESDVFHVEHNEGENNLSLI